MLKWITWILYTAVLPPIILPMMVTWLWPRVGPWITILIVCPIMVIYICIVVYYYMKLVVEYMRRKRDDKEL
jgi:hypothetical protein